LKVQALGVDFFDAGRKVFTICRNRKIEKLRSQIKNSEEHTKNRFEWKMLNKDKDARPPPPRKLISNLTDTLQVKHHYCCYELPGIGSSGVASPNFFGRAKMVDFRRATVLFGTPLL